MQKEVEVKMKVEDVSLLENALANAGCTLGEPVEQNDIVYINYNRPFVDFKTNDIFLRLRTTNEKTILTLKQGEEMNSVERETEVEDGKQMHDILTLLGFRPEVRVQKTRRKGRWKGYEVCLDEVVNLGTFIELEKVTEEDSGPAQQQMITDLISLGLKAESRVANGYDTLTWLKDHPSKQQILVTKPYIHKQWTKSKK